jgi:hypothetical protein
MPTRLPICCGLVSTRSDCFGTRSSERTMALRPVKLTSEFSYPIIRRKKTQDATFSAQRFFRRVGWKTEQALILPLKWRDRERLLEVALPPELLSTTLNSQPNRKEARRKSETSAPHTRDISTASAGMSRFLPDPPRSVEGSLPLSQPVINLLVRLKL